MSLPIASPPDVIRIITRSGDHTDCAVAAIGMACGVTYELALAACLKVEPTVLTTGMWWRNIRRAVHALGFISTTIRFKGIDFQDEDTSGILELQPVHKGSVENHIVYMQRGRIIEPNQGPNVELWDDPEMFFSHYGYRVVRLLKVTPIP